MLFFLFFLPFFGYTFITEYFWCLLSFMLFKSLSIHPFQKYTVWLKCLTVSSSLPISLKAGCYLLMTEHEVKILSRQHCVFSLPVLVGVCVGVSVCLYLYTFNQITGYKRKWKIILKLSSPLVNVYTGKKNK